MLQTTCQACEVGGKRSMDVSAKLVLLTAVEQPCLLDRVKHTDDDNPFYSDRCCCCCCNCCSGAKTTWRTLLVDDNCCRCNFAALQQLTGLKHMDIIYATYHVDVCKSYYLLVHSCLPRCHSLPVCHLSELEVFSSN